MTRQYTVSRVVGIVGGAAVAAAMVGSATLGAAPAHAAGTGTVRAAAAGTAIPGSYLVRLKDGASTTSIAKRHGARVKHTYTSVLRGFSATMTTADARSLAADPSVAYVEQDATISLTATQSGATWGLDRLDQKALPLNSSYSYSTTASNVTAYVIDTGIKTTHTDFGGRARSGYDFIGNDTDATDCNGHGTHVAGTIGGTKYGVAKAVKLVAVRVLDCNGSGSTSAVVAGIDWVAKHAVKPAVANMSLGGGASQAMDDAVRRAITAGVTFAVAAGNENANACNSSPARTPEAITAGATTDTDARASFSNWGTCLDLFAPGSAISSDYYTSDTATATMSGTSMASPHVAGAAALWLATHTTATPAQVREALVGAATPNLVTGAGTGSTTKLLYTGTAATIAPVSVTAKSFSNTTDVAIPDTGVWVYSPITVTGLTGMAPAKLAVSVGIVHPFRGDVAVDLVGPSGAAYPLKTYSNTDSVANLTATYYVDASAETANGTWKLRARDVFEGDTGFVDRWSLTF